MAVILSDQMLTAVRREDVDGRVQFGRPTSPARSTLRPSAAVQRSHVLPGLVDVRGSATPGERHRVPRR